MSRKFKEIGEDLEEIFHAALAAKDDTAAYSVSKAIKKVFCRDIINHKEFREKRTDALVASLLNLARSAYKQQMETTAESVLNDIESSILEFMLVANPEIHECGKKIALLLMERATFFAYQNDSYERFETDRVATYIFPKLVRDLYDKERTDYFMEFVAMCQVALSHVFQNNNWETSMKASIQFSNIGYKVAQKDGKQKPSDEFVKKLLSTTYGYVHIFNRRRKNGIEPQKCMEIISRLLLGVFELTPLITVPSFIKFTREMAYLLEELELNTWPVGIERIRRELPNMMDSLSEQSRDIARNDAYWYVQAWSVFPRVTCHAIFGDKSYLPRHEMGTYSSGLTKTFTAVLNIQDKQCRVEAIKSYLDGLSEFFSMTSVANEYIRENIFGILLAASLVAYQQTHGDIAKLILQFFEKSGKQPNKYINEAHTALCSRAGFNAQLTTEEFSKLFVAYFGSGGR